MKSFLIMLFIVCACGRVDTKSYSGPANILKNWRGVSENPSFSSININQSVNAAKYLICTGSYPSTTPTTSLPGYPSFNPYPTGYGTNPYDTIYDPYAGDPTNQGYSNNPYPSGTNQNCLYGANPSYGTYYGACPPNYQNNPSLRNNRYTGYASAPRGQMIVRANNENQGTISFGELPYVGANNPNCQIFSNQTLKYEVAGTRLLVCFQSPNDNICFDYSESW